MRVRRRSRSQETASAAPSAGTRACAATGTSTPSPAPYGVSIFCHTFSLIPTSPSPRRAPTGRGKYRAQQEIEGSPVNDWLSTCLCCAWMPFFTICAMHQLINDYEIKTGGKFAVCGTYTPPMAGAPAGIEMTV